MITLFTLSGHHSSRYAKRYLAQHNIDYVERPMHKKRLTFEEFKTIIRATENGIDDILSKSKHIEEIERTTKPLSEHTLKEFYYLLMEYPRLIKAPIALTKNTIIIGYDKTAYGRLIPKEIRKQGYYEMLNNLRQREDAEMRDAHSHNFRR